MKDGLYRLKWQNQCLGTITDAHWEDFPWAVGRFSEENLSKELREVLDYIVTQSATEDGLVDWPFSEELVEHWKIIEPDGEEKEIIPPIIDFTAGSITWR